VVDDDVHVVLKLLNSRNGENVLSFPNGFGPSEILREESMSNAISGSDCARKLIPESGVKTTGFC
jgi:hypothetical protein